MAGRFEKLTDKELSEYLRKKDPATIGIADQIDAIAEALARMVYR
jgi:hypothetical protein